MGSLFTSLFRALFNWTHFPFARITNSDVSGFWRDYGLWIIGGIIVIAALNTFAILFGQDHLFSVTYRD